MMQNMKFESLKLVHLIFFSVGIFLASEALLLIGITSPSERMFTERVYIPSAIAFTEFRNPKNREHPPLAKELIAASVALFGDTPLGWRFASTVFGSLTLVGVFFLALLLFQNLSAAFFTVLITAFNQLLYVQSRIALLDVFLTAFLIWALIFWVAAGRNIFSLKYRRIFLYLSGLSFGFATCCKWNAVISLFIFLGVTLVSLAIKNKKNFLDFSEFSWAEIFLSFVIGPAVGYLIPFGYYFLIPELHYSLAELIRIHGEMFHMQWHYSFKPVYSSSWWQWILMTRIMIFNTETSGVSENTVAMIGNPLIMWGGIIALFHCCTQSCIQIFKKRSLTAEFIIIVAYISFLMPWPLISRTSVAYYYYYPAGLMLSFTITSFGLSLLPRFSTTLKKYAAIGFLLLTIGFFLYFLPLLSNRPMSIEQKANRIWFNSWIDHRAE
jgi:dolichyl-phosphate-mannose-protein mannosyltransferase